ncbi:MAG: FprA family A-type flavoprotein [Bacteroidaceae bacterium]|nr:FprA family A-type flavoprotein [Bacteroidaceae bacterium]
MMNSIKYIGVDDLDIDLFESQYVVPEGMSYNSYLIEDEKIAIMDTADRRKGDEWKANLTAALAGRKPDYLVAHHMEPDHASLIAETLETYPDLKLVCSAQAMKMLPNFWHGFPFEGRVQTVKEGDTLSLGSHTLHFIAAPMVHWPEVIMSYESTEKVLFAADGFGKFGALSKEKGLEVRGERLENTSSPSNPLTTNLLPLTSDDSDWACEARRYYFNICGKYGVQVQNVLKKAAALDIQAICPLHGPVLTGKALTEAVRLYDIWSRYEPESEGVLVAYASIHGGTAKAAERMGELLREKGAKKVVVSDLSRDDMAEVIEDAFRYPKIVVMAASYDGGVFPVMHDFLYHLQIKNYQKRRFGIVENGSWAPSAGRVMKEMIEAMKDCTIAEPMVTIRSRMKPADEEQLALLAEAILKA